MFTNQTMHPTLAPVVGRNDPDGTILDCRTGTIAEPVLLSGVLKGIVGVVDHGLFVGMATRSMIVDRSGEVRILSA